MLNDLIIRKLLIPCEGAAQYPDGKIPGFGVRVTAKGVKSFYLTYRYKGRSRRMALGRYPFTGLAKARTDAHAAIVQLGNGADPQGEKAQRRASDTFSDALEAFVETYCKRHNRPSTAAETEKLLRCYFLPTWRRRAVPDIDKSDIVDVLDEIMERGKPSAARHAFAAVRKFFNWCVEQGFMELSPCAGLKPPARHNSRERVLTDDELARFWKHTEGSRDTAYVVMRLLLLTAQRCSEVCGMAWDEVNMEELVWTIPGTRTKNHKPHAVPLTRTAVAILASVPRTQNPLVFPARGKPHQSYAGYTKPKKALDEAASLCEWTLHDLRRTAATGMARLAVPPHVVERILNHVSGTFSGVAGVYNRFQYLPEMREALMAWERRILALPGSPVSGRGKD